VDLPTALGAGVLATFVPLYVGLFVPRVLTMGRRGPRAAAFLAAASAGIIFWFFVDVMLEAAQLDVNQGFRATDYTRAASHIVLALLFAAGLSALFFLDLRFRPKRPEGQVESPGTGIPLKLTFAIATMAALGIGLHALGEGVDIGSSLPNSANILDAIGGLLPGVAYVLHKLLEGFVVGVFAVLAGSISGRKLGILGLVSGAPTIIGFFVGLPSVLDAAYFFAMGAAGAVYIEIKLLPFFARTRFEYASVIPLLLGFYSIYVAGLFHS